MTNNTTATSSSSSAGTKESTVPNKQSKAVKLKSGVTIDIAATTHAGKLTQVVHQKVGNDFVILKVGGVNCIGLMHVTQMAAQYTFEGKFEENKKYNTWDFKFKSFEVKIDASSGLRELLIREAPGIGPASASRLVTIFKDETLAVIENEPEKVTANCPQIKYAAAFELQAWVKGIKKNIVIREKLYAIGLTPGLIDRLIEHFGVDAASKIKEDCFQLIGIPGIGFKTADKISDMLGIPHNNPGRIKAAILHCMDTLSEQGHTCIPKTELIRDVIKLAVIDHSAASKHVEDLISQEILLTEENKAAQYAEKTGRVLN